MKRRVALLIAIAAVVILAFSLLPKKEPQVLWLRDTSSAWPNSAAIATDGTLYFGDFGGNLTAVSAEGRELWRTNLCQNAPSGNAYVTSATIGSDGSIYVITGDGRISAVSPKAELRWSKPINAKPYSQISIGSDDTLYAVSRSGLHAFTSEGIERWHFQAGRPMNGTSVVGRDGTVYASTYDTNLYAIAKFGNVKWHWTTPAFLSESLIVDTNGTVYVAAHPALNAINHDGSVKWSITNANAASVLLLDGQCRLYCATATGVSAADATTGKTLWSRDIVEIGRIAALGADGSLYVSADTGTLYAIESSTGKIRWTFTRRPADVFLHRVGEWLDFAFSGFSSRRRRIYPCAFTLSHRPVLYAVMPDYKIYALAVPAGLATNAPWPMFQHDVRHTSSIGPAADR